MAGCDQSLVMEVCRSLLMKADKYEVKVRHMGRRFVVPKLEMEMTLKTSTAGVKYTMKGRGWKVTFISYANFLRFFETNYGLASDIDSDMTLLMVAL